MLPTLISLKSVIQLTMLRANKTLTRLILSDSFEYSHNTCCSTSDSWGWSRWKMLSSVTELCQTY